MLHIISLGAGVQSSTMALMFAKGELTPMPDCAIFADTQGEPRAVYEWLHWLSSQLPFPVYVVTRGSLWEAATHVRRTRDGQRTYIRTAIPVYTVDGVKRGIGMRQCTRDFKIDPINAKVRELLGRRRITKKDGVLAEMFIGISFDELDRMKPSQKSWIRTMHPLVDAGMSRADCLDWMQRNGYPEPPRSACTFCPFRSDDHWLALAPDELADAIAKEEQLQTAYGEASALRAVPYLHESRVPLSQVKFRPGHRRKMAEDQRNLFRQECAGMCGV